jgi:hypothetical protein
VKRTTQRAQDTSRAWTLARSRRGPGRAGRTPTAGASGLPSRCQARTANPGPTATASWLPAACLPGQSPGLDLPGKRGNP